jgi:predicted ribosome quality control (RQC) complex YloA/Tae2 family protein
MKILAEHLPAICAELSSACCGLQVKDIAGLPPRDMLLILDAEERDPQGPPVHRIRLSAARRTPRVHMQHGRTRRHKGPIGPFFQTLQEELIGARVESIRAVRDDRIMRIDLVSTPSGEARSLLLELFGAHANLYLLGPQDRLIAYLIPPGQPKDGSAPRLALDEPWQAPDSGGFRGDFPSLEASFPDPETSPKYTLAPLSWRIEAALDPLAEAHHLAEERKRLVSRVERKLARAEHRLQGLIERESATHTLDRIRQDGELLKACMGQLKRGMTHVVVQDWFAENTPERRLELDPGLTPHENVQKYFARFKKLQRSANNLESEMQQARERKDDLQALLEVAREHEDPTQLDEDSVERGLLDARQEADPRKKAKPRARLPYRTFEAHDGSEIRVGRSARDNDDLTFRHARGNDLWLHTADVPGSHVILRAGRNREFSDKAILDAAMLAIHFSPQTNAGRASVHLVPQKQVHKPKGAKPGLVTLSGGKRRVVRMDEARVKDLLRTQGV